MKIVCMDNDIVVCIKPPRVLSTDESGGVPELLRRELGDDRAELKTVHRLDRVVGGLMVLARNAQAASELSRQIREGFFKKEYLAVVHGQTPERGELCDLLARDKARKMTYVVQTPAKGVQEARLSYERLWHTDSLSMLRIELHTGRTHQIRCQFASRGFPLVGERKYNAPQDDCEIALWSHMIGFYHPRSGEWMQLSQEPPRTYPWTLEN